MGSEAGSLLSRGSQRGRPLHSQVRSGLAEPFPRAVRSPGSSESSTDRARVVKDACRAVIQFMFTQVGVGGLVVGYTIVGAVAFQAIEGAEPEDLIARVEGRREEAVQQLWNITKQYNTLNEERSKQSIHQVIKDYQESMTGYIRAGYDEKTVEERWTFPAALMFTLSVITMIGYGNIVPRTEWGRIATMLYALFGIPVYILYFMNMGKVLANMFKWVYRRVAGCIARRRAGKAYGAVEDGLEVLGEELPVPSTAALWVMLAYLTLGTVMFAEWEQWNYLDSVYFVVTSLLKIGLGDYVPGCGIGADGELHHAKLYINYSYLLLGMGVVAMNYNLLKEEVLVKAAQARKKLHEACSRGKPQ